MSSKPNQTKSTVQTKEQSSWVKRYLFTYNAVQVVGWTYIIYLLTDYYLLQGPEFRAFVTLWNHTKIAVIIFQNAAVVEILNAIFGLVKSNPVITTIQVVSRINVLIGFVMATPTGMISSGLPLALLAWSITEIIRYGYYALNIIKIVPHFMTVLRYTLFIGLYPLGVTGELLCCWSSLTFAKSHSVWSIVMPNKWNMTFSYYTFLSSMFVIYAILFPDMYLHMFSQRKKILGSGKEKKN